MHEYNNAMCSRLKFISVNVRIGIIIATGSFSDAGSPPYLSGERVMVIVSESSVHGHPGSMM